MEKIELKNEYGACSVNAFGGHILSWQPTGEREVFYRPRKATYKPEKTWVHGGVPPCFPWFGSIGPRYMHGFARYFPFTVAAKTPSCVTLVQESSAATRKLWPFDYRVTYTITLGAKLHVAFQVTNTGREEFMFTDGLHPYFHVGDATQVRVTGLNGCAYWRDGKVQPKWWVGDFGFEKPCDNVFWVYDRVQKIIDPTFKRTIVMTSAGSKRIVIWNPGPDEKDLLNLDADSWKHLVCVEPATLPEEDGFVLKPGESHTLDVTFEVIAKGE